MTLGLLFWILMILWLIGGLYSNWPTAPGPSGFYPLGVNLLLWILLFLLGWKVFGFVIQQ